MKTTTNEGFLMNTFRRISSHMVKALAAGAVLVATALPLAIAGTAGAAVDTTNASITFTPVGLNGASLAAGQTSVGVGASGTFSITGLSGLLHDGGSITVSFTGGAATVATGVSEPTSTSITGSFAHLGASDSTATIVEDGTNDGTLAFTLNAAPTAPTLAPNSIVNGTTVTVTFSSPDFTAANGNVELALAGHTTGTALQVGAVTNLGNGSATASVTALGPNGAPANDTSYDVYIQNPDGGTSVGDNALSVGPMGITNVSPSSINVPSTGSTNTSVTVAGAGFETGAVDLIPGVTTSLLVPLTAVTLIGATTFTVSTASAQSIYVGEVATLGASTAGTLPADDYVTNVTGAGVVTISAGTTGGSFLVGDTVNFEPTANAAPISTINTGANCYAAGTHNCVTVAAASATQIFDGESVVDVTVGAHLAVPTTVIGVNTTTGIVTLSSTTAAVVGATDTLNFALPTGLTITQGTTTSFASSFSLAVTHLASSELLDVTVVNPAAGPTGGDRVTVIDGLGIGQASNTTAIITGASVSPAGPVAIGGATTTTLTLSGTGFGPGDTVTLASDYAIGTYPVVTATGCVANAIGTTLACNVVAPSGASANTYNATVTSGTKTSTAFDPALTVAGPIITAQSPASIPVGAKVGTVITLTGTGLTGLTSGNVVDNTGVIAGIFQVISASTATLTLTVSPTVADANDYAAGAGYPYLHMEQYMTVGNVTDNVVSDFSLTIGAAPTVTALYNASGATLTTFSSVAGKGIGTGALNFPVVLTGTGFTAGTTIGSFVNPGGVADPGVTVSSVTYVKSTEMTAAISIAAGDANLSDGYTVTTPAGSSVTVAPYSSAAIYIEAGPTVTAVSPSLITRGVATALTVTGTGFSSTLDSAVSIGGGLGTCGSTTFVSSTSLTATCTLGAAGTGATDLLVTNTDGGTGTFALTTTNAPGAPTGVTSTGGTGSIVVTWVAPASTGGSPITGYVVTGTAGTSTVSCGTLAATATTCTLTGLAAGTAYTVSVEAVNAIGASTTGTGTGYTATTAAALTAPGAPTGVTATGGQGSIAVSWTAPASAGSSAITGYVVTGTAGNTTVSCGTVAATATTCTLSGLANATAYAVSVEAVNAVGSSTAGTATATTLAAVAPVTAPGAPTGVTATGGQNSIAVSWTAPASTGGSAITGYIVTGTAGIVTTSCGTLAASATSCILLGLSNSSTYAVSVVAVNAIGNSAAGTATATTLAAKVVIKVFRVTGVHGIAFAGRTVTVTISGVGFYAAPRITSNVAGTTARVVKDSGRLLTVHVTVRAGTPRGIGIFTIRLANGKTARVKYSHA